MAQLVGVRVKETWPDADGDGVPDVPPFAGHLIRYTYDALGRLSTREHLGKLPANGIDLDRPFIEMREYVWDGSGLSTEVAYGAPDKTQPRWRITRIPGPQALDDAPQVLVEVEPTFPGSPYAGTTRRYTLLRDEMGSVVGIAPEDEGPRPDGKPPIPVRFLYTPYGEAHAEDGPELRTARVDSIKVELGRTKQQIPNRHLAAPGAFVADWSLGLDPESLSRGVAVERLVPDQGWQAVGDSEVAIGLDPQAQDGTRLVVLPLSGWQASSTYRVRLTSELEDTLGRRLGHPESLEWKVATPPAAQEEPVAEIKFFVQRPLRYESWQAARESVEGRFPGGVGELFEGLWTDPVTGLNYARARWYDSRNGSWLSEDPAGTVDSPNIYAFVGWQPNMQLDPMGLCKGRDCWLIFGLAHDPVGTASELVRLGKEKLKSTASQAGSFVANDIFHVEHFREAATGFGPGTTLKENALGAGVFLLGGLDIGANLLTGGGEGTAAKVAEKTAVEIGTREVAELEARKLAEAGAKALAGDAAEAGIRHGATDAAVDGLKSLQLQRRLAEVTTEQRNALVESPELLARYLTPAEVGAVKDEPWRMTLFFGTALERRVAREAARDAELSVLEHTVNNAPQDFIGPGGVAFDITGSSVSSILSHARRKGVDFVITYESVPKDLGKKFLSWIAEHGG